MTIGIKIILPKKVPFDLGKFQKSAIDTLNDVREGVQRDFESTTATWKNKPGFKGKRATGISFVSRMWSNQNQWIWVSGGTRPHIIVPRRASRLRFQSGYRRKTTVGRLGSRAGGSFGGTVFAKAVRHPGNKPAGFEKTSADKWQPKLVKMVKQDIRDATN